MTDVQYHLVGLDLQSGPTEQKLQFTTTMCRTEIEHDAIRHGGSTMAYTYDCLGRLTSVRSPKDTSDPADVRHRAAGLDLQSRPIEYKDFQFSKAIPDSADVPCRAAGLDLRSSPTG